MRSFRNSRKRRIFRHLPGPGADLFAWFEDLDRRFQRQDPAFGAPNSRLLRRIWSALGQVIPAAETENSYALSPEARKLLARLDSLTGLDSVKEQVHQLALSVAGSQKSGSPEA